MHCNESTIIEKQVEAVESKDGSSSSKEHIFHATEELGALHTKGRSVISILLSVWIIIAVGLFVYSADMPTVRKDELKNPPFDESLEIGQIKHQTPNNRQIVLKNTR